MKIDNVYLNIKVAFMSLHRQQIAPLKSWDEFEELCLALFRAEWRDGLAQKNGRQGQWQAGVDIFGYNYAMGGALWGVQCKGKTVGYGSKLSRSEIDAELCKADTFRPKLAQWIIATTAATDAPLQKYVRELSQEREAKGMFPISIFFWDGITSLLALHREVAVIFYPEQFCSIAHTSQPLHLPATTLSSFFSDPLDHCSMLRQQLQTKGSALVVATIQGMGGVGKTQLALKYSLDHQADYVGVWWFSAETASTLEQECILFCAKQGIALVPGEAPGRAMCNWLATQAGWLLVYDNAEDEAVLSTSLPQAGAHHVLITSRWSTWAGIAKLALDVWLPHHALQFLRLRMSVMVGIGVAESGQLDCQFLALTTALDGLPLALEQACAYILKNKVAIQAYVDRVRAYEDEQGLLEKNDSRFCTLSVLATLSLAFEKLNEPARKLLGLCAWLAAEPIPEYLFTENPDFLPPALNIKATDEFSWRETVAELESYSLCQAGILRVADHMGNGAESVRCLNFHRLTQAAMRANLHGEAVGRIMLVLVTLVFPSGENGPMLPESWQRCRTLMAHVMCLQELYREEWDESYSYGSMLVLLAQYLKHGLVNYREAARLESQAYCVLVDSMGEDHPQTLAAANGLAQTLQLMGDWHRARILHQKVLEIRYRIMGADHRDTLESMTNLATIFLRMGDVAGARMFDEKVLEVHRRVQGEEHPDTLLAVNNLAKTILQMGDLSRARTLLERALLICRRVLGEEGRLTLIMKNNLAASMAGMGDFASARLLHEDTLELKRRVLGDEHPSTLQTLKNLAHTLADLGEFPDAQRMMAEVVDTRCRVLGEEHPDTIVAKQGLIFLKDAQYGSTTV